MPTHEERNYIQLYIQNFAAVEFSNVYCTRICATLWLENDTVMGNTAVTAVFNTRMGRILR